MELNKTLYKINWHSVDGVFTHVTVTPIAVIREGVLEGCTGVSITAIDSDGRKFQGSPDNYFNSEEEAWAAVARDMEESIRWIEEDLADRVKELEAIRTFLGTLKEGKK